MPDYTMSEEERQRLELAMKQGGGQPVNTLHSQPQNPMDMKLRPEQKFAFVESADPQRAAAAYDKRMAEIRDFSQNNAQMKYERRTAFENRQEHALNDMLGRGVNPDVAAKVTAEKIMGYKDSQAQDPTRYMNTGNGVFDPSSGQMVPGTAKPEERPAYPWQEGMPPMMLLDDGVVGVVDEKGKYFQPKAVQLKETWGFVPGTDRQGYYMAPNYDVSALKKYGEWGKAPPPEEPPPSQADLQVVLAANPGWDEEKAARYLKRIGR